VVENVYGTFFLIDLVDLVDLNVPTLINEWTHQRGGPKGPLGDKVPGNIIVKKLSEINSDVWPGNRKKTWDWWILFFWCATSREVADLEACTAIMTTFGLATTDEEQHAMHLCQFHLYLRGLV
jgi:hypothetical protein